MRQREPIRIAMLAVAAALSVSGCNDDDGDERTSGAGPQRAADGRAERSPGDRGSSRDVREIRRVIRRFALINNARIECRELATRDLVQRIYGDIPQCEKASRPERGDRPPTDVRISRVSVKSDSATARIRLIGGDVARSTGTLELRRQDGRWRVDDLGVDLLRSLIVNGLENERDEQALRRPRVRRCVQRAFARLSDDELKRVAYLTLSEREGSNEEVAKLMVPCLAAPGSGAGPNRSYLRDEFEKGIRREARQRDVPPAVADCLVARLRSLVTNSELTRLALRDEESSPAIARKLARAAAACRSQAPPRSSS